MKQIGIRELRRLASIKMLKESMPFEILAGGEVIANVRQGRYDVRQEKPIVRQKEPDVRQDVRQPITPEDKQATLKQLREVIKDIEIDALQSTRKPLKEAGNSNLPPPCLQSSHSSGWRHC